MRILRTKRLALMADRSVSVLAITLNGLAIKVNKNVPLGCGQTNCILMYRHQKAKVKHRVDYIMVVGWYPEGTQKVRQHSLRVAKESIRLSGPRAARAVGNR